MHLSYSTSSYKGQTFKSYSIAESLREGGTVGKRIVWPLGKLTDQQAQQIRSILNVVQGKDMVLTRLEDIVVEENRSYLDIAVVNHIRDQWALDKAFNYGATGGPLPTDAIARILTINRCTDPCSNHWVPVWAEKTALAEVLDVDLSGLNDDKIYYELDKIQTLSATNASFQLLARASRNAMASDRSCLAGSSTAMAIHSNGTFSPATRPGSRRSSATSTCAKPHLVWEKAT
jgi:hypothetical protein